MTQTIHWRQDERREPMKSDTPAERADKREAKRLKGQNVVRTKAFRTPQKFGAASGVRTISVEQYEHEQRR